MRQSISITLSAVLIMFIFCFSHCKKEKKETNSLNITLYDKPLDTIKFYIQGKWNLCYAKGGICAICTQRYSNFYWTFSLNNKIEKSLNGTVIADASINWFKDSGTFTNGDSTYILNFYDKQNVPWNYVVERIYNDTLIIHDNSADAVFYRLTKL